MHEDLFCDATVSHWLGVGHPGDDVAHLFAEAKELALSGRLQGACDLLSQIARNHSVSVRDRLEAWHLLRAASYFPAAADLSDCFAVVAEVGVHGGIDVLAIYSDGDIHYRNHAGGGAIWNRPDDSMDELTGTVVKEARELLPKVGIWHEPRRAPPQADWVRLNIVNPEGLRFGEARWAVLEADPAAKPLLLACTRVLVAVSKLLPLRPAH